MTKYIPPLMASLLSQFDAGELVEFIQFISLLVHRLQVQNISCHLVINNTNVSQDQILDVLDQLISPLSSHIISTLSIGTNDINDRQVNMETKKAYLSLLNSIMAAKLYVVFTSERKSIPPYPYSTK